jgi:Fic family protein
MKPYDNTDLPVEFKYDLEMMKLLIRARELYTKYNTIITYQEISSKLILKPFILQESYKSCELAGNPTAHSSLYYIKYQPESMHTKEILNYNSILDNIGHYLSSSFKLSVWYLNNIHKDLFKHLPISPSKLGKYRDEVTWIGPRGSSIYDAEYVPSHPLDIPVLMSNYIKYFNKSYSSDKLIEMAISHAQFENIHPYKDANGRIGRILVPIQAFIETNTHVSVFVSEVIKDNEYMYYRKLQDTRNSKWEGYIKFFLEIVIKQLERNIKRIDEMLLVYKQDLPKVISLLNEKKGKIIYEYLFSNITSTIKEASDYLHIDYQTIRNHFKRLFDVGLIAKHKVNKGEYVYTYIRMYNIHVPVNWI